MHLYDYFGVSNAQELYELLQANDPSVDHLQNFLVYAQQEFTNDHPAILSVDALQRFVKENRLFPQENEAYVIGFTSQMSPTFYAKIDGDMTTNEVLDKALRPDIRTYAVVDRPKQHTDNVLEASIEEKINFLEEVYGVMDKKAIDRLSIMGEQDNPFVVIYSHEGDTSDLVEADAYSDTPNYQDFIIGNDSINDFPVELTVFSELTEFVDYYVSKELEGLNVHYDKEQINALLNMKATPKKQEVFSVITYDDNLNINGVKDMFVGTYSNATLDLAFIMDYVNKPENQGFIVSHNHPGGGLHPSQADLRTTETIVRLGELFDKPLFDHLIASKRGVTSLAEESKLDFDVKVKGLSETQDREVTNYLKKAEAISQDITLEENIRPAKQQGRTL